MVKYTLIQTKILLLILLSGLGFAQDTNYWTYQYGSRSTILGGAVIGSVLDLSGTYYNPGGLSLIDDPDVLLAAKVFDYPRYTLSGAGIENAELSSSRLKPAPSIVATMFKFDWLGDHRLGISVFTRYDIMIDFKNTIILSQNSQVPESNGDSFIADFRLGERLNELWGGITWSYKVGPKLGVGISQFLTFRSHRANIRTFAETTDPDGSISLLMNGREYEYDNYRILWKLGVTFDFQGLIFGVTTTTPSVGFYNTGRSGLNITYIGEDLDGNGKQDTWTAAHYQKDVDSNFRSPLSIGLGTTFKIKRTHIYFSAEWYSGVKKYDVIKPVYFEAQVGGDTLQNGVTHELDEVLNVGIGVEHSFNQHIAINGSFTTDFSAAIPDSDTNLSVASWDIYHILIGTTFRIKKSQFTLGFGYSYGNSTLDTSKWRLVDLEYGVGDQRFEQIDYRYRNYKFVFGFSI